MDTKTLSATLLKVAGLVVLAWVAVQLPSYFPLAIDPYAPRSLADGALAASIALAPMALLGAVFWFFPGSITNRILFRSGEKDAPVAVADVERVALTVLGVYLVVHGIVDVVYNAITVINVHRSTLEPKSLPPITIAGIAASALEALLGACLALRARGLVGFLERARG